MKSKMKKWTMLSLCATMCLSCAFAVIGLAPNMTVKAEETTTETETTSVAKVGDTEYATIDEAIANWTHNTWLTLTSNVTLTDVITLKSTEHHKLNLGTYTMTAATGKNAIEIKSCGMADRGERESLTITADETLPGGINAGSKSCIYYKYDSKLTSTYDRPIIYINGGVFTGSSYSGLSSVGHNKDQDKCATFNISDGTFNCGLNLTKTKLLISGGTFNASVSCTGGGTSCRVISGGTFKSFLFMTAGPSGNEQKFTVGNTKNNFDCGLYVDENGYLVVGGPVITEAGDQFEASSTYDSWSQYLEYSSANANGLYYKKAETAVAKKKAVTLYTDELDLTGNTATLTSTKITLDEDDALTVYFNKGSAAKLPTIKTDITDKKAVYEDVEISDTVIKRTYTVVDDVVLAKVNEDYCETALDFVNAIEEDAVITLYEDIDLINGNDTQPVTFANLGSTVQEIPDVLVLPDGVTINGNGNTIIGTVYTDSALTLTGDTKITTLYVGANSEVTGAEKLLSDENTNIYNMEKYTFTLTTDQTALKATESLNLTVSIDKAYYSAEYTFKYDTTKFSCAADTNDDGVIFVSNLFKGTAGVLATYTLVAKNDIQSVYVGDVFSVTGNVVQFKEQTLNDIKNEVIGDTETIKISLNYTAGVKEDYVQGYSLVLVKGDDAGYAYNGVKMFYVEAYGAYAVLVEGAVTAEMIDVALSKTTNCEKIRQSYNVNAEYVNDGIINIKDATAAYACSILDFDVADYMELFLRADVNGDCKVNMVDVNAVIKNYTK